MTIWLILLYILVTATIAVVIINTNSSSKALGYLLLIIMLPILGIIIYFTIGVNYRKRKLYKKKLKVDKVKYPFFEEKYHQNSQRLLQANEEKLGSFFPLAENKSVSLLGCGYNTQLLINGEEKFPKLLADLKTAQHSIHLEYYIFEDDELGNAIGNILIEKAQKGIKVRVSYDDFGSSHLSNSFIKKLRQNDVEVVPFFKIRWLLFANRINYRNHRKIVVIDGKIGYVGGINISKKYDNNYTTNQLYWRDTSVRLEGNSVANLQYIFLVDWNFCANQNIPFSTELFPRVNENNSAANYQLMQTTISGPDSDYPNILFAMMQAIMLCKKELLITTPYFSPTASFVDALKIASLSGVAVKLLVPGISDSVLVNAISNSYYSELLQAGIEIYKYKKGFVHAKTIVCDSQVSFVGTANLDQRSFELNFEIHQIIYDTNIAMQLKNAFYNDIKSSVQIDKEQWNNRSKIVVFGQRVARLLSPLI